jgi:pilus assembly protein CpaB
MRARSIALLLLALGCGLVASIGITQVIGNRNAGSADTSGDTEAIFVALQDVPFGEPLTPQVLRLENWPKGKVPAGALCRIEDVEGRLTRTKLYAGEPILENKLAPKGAKEQGYSTEIPQGFRVIPVKVDRLSGSGLILPGNRVDVLVHLFRNPARGILKTSTRTILQDVKVFAVNDVVDTEAQGDKKMSAQTISLLVTPEHAQMIMLAEELGKIRLVMRSPTDDKIATVQDTTPSELLDTAEAEDRQSENQPGQSTQQGAGLLALLGRMRSNNAAAPGPQNTPGHKVHHMRLVSGSEVRDVVLEQEEDPSAPASEWWTVSNWQPAAPAANPASAGGMPETAEPIPQPEQAPAPQQKQPPGPQEASK